MPQVLFEKYNSFALKPQRKSNYCYDVYTCESFSLAAGQHRIVDIGIALDYKYFCLPRIIPKLKHSAVDADEIIPKKVTRFLLHNTGDETQTFALQSIVAQLVFFQLHHPSSQLDIYFSKQLPISDRGCYQLGPLFTHCLPPHGSTVICNMLRCAIFCPFYVMILPSFTACVQHNIEIQAVEDSATRDISIYIYNNSDQQVYLDEKMPLVEIAFIEVLSHLECLNLSGDSSYMHCTKLPNWARKYKWFTKMSLTYTKEFIINTENTVTNLENYPACAWLSTHSLFTLDDKKKQFFPGVQIINANVSSTIEIHLRNIENKKICLSVGECVAEMALLKIYEPELLLKKPPKVVFVKPQLK